MYNIYDNALASLLITPFSYFMNNFSTEKGLEAFKYLLSSRNKSNAEKEAYIKKLQNVGWKDENELFEFIRETFEVNAIGIGAVTERFIPDTFDRYFIQLKDKLLLLKMKYDIVLTEYLEKIIYDYKTRKEYYKQHPDKLHELRKVYGHNLKKYIGGALQHSGCLFKITVYFFLGFMTLIGIVITLA